MSASNPAKDVPAAGAKRAPADESASLPGDESVSDPARDQAAGSSASAEDATTKQAPTNQAPTNQAPTNQAPTNQAPTGKVGTRTYERKPEGPRKVRNGIKLRAHDAVVPSTPLSDAIVRRLEASIPADELEEGLRYARLGQIVSMQHDDGILRGRVQGRSARPYETRIPFGAYSSEDWDRVIEAMAAEAMYVVKLLANELPEGLDTLLEGLGLRFLPAADEPLVSTCTCPRAGNCRHVAALGYVFAEQIVNAPLLVFALRGMPLEQVLERLRQTRTLQAHGVAAAHSDPMIPESKREPPPLEMCVDEFWRPGRAFGDVQSVPPSKHLPHALLRRLGPSPLRGKFPLVGLLASIYDAVSEHAARMRDHVEDID